MEQAHSRSHKRANPLNTPPTESPCHWSCHRDQPGDYDPRVPKRQQVPGQLRFSLDPSDVFPVGSDDSPHTVHSGDYLPIHSQTNIGVNEVEDEFSFFLAERASSSQPYLGIANQTFPLLAGEDVRNKTAETSPSCTASNDTFSPRSMKQVLSDTNEDPTRSRDNVNEELFASSEDFGFGMVNEWPWGILDNDLLQFGDSANLNVPFMNEPIMEADNEAFSLFDQFLVTQYDGRGSPSVPAIVNRLTAQPNPWPYPLSIDDGLFESPTSANSYKSIVSLKASGTPLPQRSEWRALQPSKKSFTDPSHLQLLHGKFKTKPFLFINGENPDTKPPRRPGCRGGPLSTEKRKQIKRMRHAGACWLCRFVKVKCSLEGPCERCKIPKLPPRICYRTPLNYLTEAFFPSLVCSRFSETAIEDLIRRKIAFTNNNIEVEMKSGPAYPTMRITVTEFTPLDEDFLVLKFVAPAQSINDPYQRFVPSYAPPFGLCDPNLDILKGVCSDHIKAIIEKERNFGEAMYGDISMISWKAFEAVNRYRRLSRGTSNVKGFILKKAVMLHGMHYFMSRIITFSEPSIEKAVEKLRKPPKLLFAPTLTSTLLNLQLKQAMQCLLRETTRSVLEGLEKMLLRPKTHATWIDTFCIVLILCICIESVQVISDSHAMAELCRDPKSKFDRLALCRGLDNQLFKELTYLFHMAYKTQKTKKKSRLGCNPIRKGLVVDLDEGVTPQMVNLVNEIKHILEVHGDEMAETASNPSFDPKPDLLTHHMAFRKRNSGRLVSTFLSSLISDTSVM